MGNIARRLAELGLTLPTASAPAANYAPFAATGNLLFIAGQLPLKDGKLHHCGRLGDGVTVEAGYQAARLCALNIIAQINAAGALEKVARIVRLGGFVACTAEFTDHPKVVNGASDLLVEVFGDAGRHARAAVGCPALPLGAAVEVDAIVELTDS
ncbi:MAG TPA: RidA family protein [Rhodospirillaceae bacterium]|nr:RidA family protein [Rhodospirillaceae bacterium]